MFKNWRFWVLSILFFGPFVAYIGLGFLWLKEHQGPIGFRGELVTYAAAAWILSYVAFSVLASRWTRDKRSLLPPIDWDAPQTFNDHDRAAWDVVQKKAAECEALPMEALTRFDTYIDTGRSLAGRLARHYHPNATDPVEHVAIVDVLTALQLASEDLAHLCREVPGGDMVTPAHWKRAVQAANYLQRANEIYTFLLPLFQPAAGLMRLGTQKLMVQPAWKNMQQNLMRWFFRAYVNRLGTHLVELYSGRLAIGADHYRRLARRFHGAAPDGGAGPLVIGVAGARGSGRSSLLAALDVGRVAQSAAIRDRLRSVGLDVALADQLRAARLVEIPGYAPSSVRETARDRSLRRQAVHEARSADLLLLVVEAGREDFSAEARFLEQLAEWFASHPGRSQPPVLVALTGIDRPEMPGGWAPPYDWVAGDLPRERWVRGKLVALRAVLPPTVEDAVAVALGPEKPYGVAEHLLPALAVLLHRAERAALLRHLESLSGRSKVGRLVNQVGRSGRRLWEGVRSARDAASSPR